MRAHVFTLLFLMRKEKHKRVQNFCVAERKRRAVAIAKRAISRRPVCSRGQIRVKAAARTPFRTTCEAASEPAPPHRPPRMDHAAVGPTGGHQQSGPLNATPTAPHPPVAPASHRRVGQGHSNQRTTTCNVPVLDIEIETGKRKREKKEKGQK